MYDKPFAVRLKWLIDTKRKPNGTKFSVPEVAQALEGKMGQAYLYQLLRGEKKNPSLDAIEALADFFQVTPLFFASDPKNFVPPVNAAQVQIALRSVAALDADARRTLDELIDRANTIG